MSALNQRSEATLQGPLQQIPPTREQDDHDKPTFWQTYQQMEQDARTQDQFVKVVADAVRYAVGHNDRRKSLEAAPAGKTSPLWKSFVGEPPPISAEAYVKRIYKYGGLSSCNLVVALIIADRFWTTERGQLANGEEVAFIPLSTKNFQRLYLVAAMVASKFWDGYHFSNAHWAEVGGISLKELNRLELKFLFGLAFRLDVGRDEYDYWCQELCRLLHTARAQEAAAQLARVELGLDPAAPDSERSPGGPLSAVPAAAGRAESGERARLVSSAAAHSSAAASESEPAAPRAAWTTEAWGGVPASPLRRLGSPAAPIFGSRTHVLAALSRSKPAANPSPLHRAAATQLPSQLDTGSPLTLPPPHTRRRSLPGSAAPGGWTTSESEDKE